MRTSSDFNSSEQGTTVSSQTESRRGDDCCGRGQLYIIGIGPGNIEEMSRKAYRLLKEVEVVVGYQTYLELIEDIATKDQQLISTGMGKEKARAKKAVSLAKSGKEVALISSGDAGVYGMAGLALEVLNQAEVKPAVEVVPGITAANAAAARLGAPLMHDYTVISLSDLLTEWEVIENRLVKAAEGDFITALYNPKSAQRTEQIKLAQEIFLNHRRSDTPVGVVKQVGREGEEVIKTKLDKLLQVEIDMVTTVIIGNSETYQADDLLITPRGYQV